MGQFGNFGGADNSIFCHLLTPLEVVNDLRAMKNHTSPRPDGITKGELLSRDPIGEKLAHIFSTWLVSGKPGAFKKCQTTLIPKVSDPAKQGDVNEWRPITIGSVVVRLFLWILTIRMTGVCPLSL